jgi:hypothetical protein
VQVDAVKNRARESLLVALAKGWAALAGFVFAAKVATGTRVCGGEEDEARWVRYRTQRANDGYLSIFQGLAQALGALACELGKLIKEQHTAVREGNFSRFQGCPSTNKARVRNGVVWLATGRLEE